MRLLLVILLLSVTACGPEFERRTGQVIGNAGGVIKGGKQEVDKQWQPANPKPAEAIQESEEELQDKRRY